ncbi:MAG: efflux transporter outer membrane subunit [Prevotella sp.]
MKRATVLNKTIIIYLTLATATLSSCGIYTKYERTAEVPDGLYGEVGAMENDTTRGIGCLPWRNLFTDPNLQSLIEEGLQHNTDLLTSEQRILEAEATLRSARLALLPSLSLSLQGAVSSFDGQKAVKTYSLPLTTSWEADVSGKLRNARRQSKALYEQSIDYKQAVQSQLISNIANCYYTLLMLDEQLQISRETEQSWAETVAATRAMVSAGMANEAGVAQMEAARNSVSVSILDTQEQINQVENSMAKLLSSTPRHITRGSLAQQSMPESVSCGIPLSLLSARPDVRVAERQLEYAFYGVNAARSALYPSITLSGSVGWTNNGGGIVSNPAKILAEAAAQLTQPIFAQGKLRGQLKIAKAQQEEARLSFTQTLLDAGVEVNDAYTQYQTAIGKTAHLDQQVENLEKAEKSTLLLMEHGTSTYLDVLTARQSLLSARLTQVANRFSCLQGVVNLYKALGGGAE